MFIGLEYFTYLQRGLFLLAIVGVLIGGIALLYLTPEGVKTKISFKSFFMVTLGILFASGVLLVLNYILVNLIN